MMRPSSILGSVLPLLLIGGAARADEGASAERMPDPDAPTSPTPQDTHENLGLKIAEGLVLHPSFELSTAYQPNVFFEDEQDVKQVGRTKTGATVLRVGVGGALATESPQRMEIEGLRGASARQRLAFRGDVNLMWNQFLSSDQTVKQQSDVGASALVSLKLNPEGTLSFEIRDGYTRVVNPPPAKSEQDVDHDKNDVNLGLTYRPGGGALEGFANYSFGFDFFERQKLAFSNRSSHTLSAGGRWKWLPRTQFNAEFQGGLIAPSSEAVKASSTPMRAWFGLNTMVTAKTGAVIKLGYGNGGYADGPTFGGLLAQVEARMAVAPTQSMSLVYKHDFADSVLANYYSDHSLGVHYGVKIGARGEAKVVGEFHYRTYDYPKGADGSDVYVYNNITRICGDGANPCTTSARTDWVTHLSASADYKVSSWMAAGAGYTLNAVTTDAYSYDLSPENMFPLDSSGYIWHEFLVRLAARF